MWIMESKESPRFTGVWVNVPTGFLERFDKEIEDTFPSRSEAIRRGMNLILKELQSLRDGPRKGGGALG